MSKKQLNGRGWSFQPADPEAAKRSVISQPPEQQQARITVEKRRKGKVVTVVQDLVLARSDMKALAKKLKQACGVGGAARDDAVELQGDCRDAARSWLEANGWGLR